MLVAGSRFLEPGFRIQDRSLGMGSEGRDDRASVGEKIHADDMLAN